MTDGIPSRRRDSRAPSATPRPRRPDRRRPRCCGRRQRGSKPGRPAARAGPRSCGRPPCAKSPGRSSRASARGGGRGGRERWPSTDGADAAEAAFAGKAAPGRRERGDRSWNGTPSRTRSWRSAAPGLEGRTRAKTPAPDLRGCLDQGLEGAPAEEGVGRESIRAQSLDFTPWGGVHPTSACP